MSVMREAPIPSSELNQTFLQASLPALNFYLLLAIASAIALWGGVNGYRRRATTP